MDDCAPGLRPLLQDAAEPLAASIIIPAHNEATIIGRLLDAIPRQIDGNALQIIVACNGCTDDTAGVARRHHGVTVIDVPVASKIAALNAADAAARAFPRLYVDADILMTPRTVADLVRALKLPGALYASPPTRMETTGRPWLVRAYLAFWRHLMTVRGEYTGAGVFGLSEHGRARFGQFPDVIADDTFVQDLFSADERQMVDTDPTVVQAPWTVAALLRRRVRVRVGGMQLNARSEGTAAHGARAKRFPWWKVALQDPALLPHSIVYATINLVARFRARRQYRGNRPVDWGRDHTTR